MKEYRHLKGNQAINLKKYHEEGRDRSAGSSVGSKEKSKYMMKFKLKANYSTFFKTERS